MNKPLKLDFARNRASQHTRRFIVLAVLFLGFGLQFGSMAWRYQSAQLERARLDAKDRQRLEKSALGEYAGLSQEQIKIAAHVRTMLQSLSVPWSAMLGGIEKAQTPRITIEAIAPTKDGGTVRISIVSADFYGVAEFVERLQQQAQLSEVTLLSETRLENSDVSLRAVIQAHWRHTP